MADYDGANLQSLTSNASINRKSFRIFFCGNNGEFFELLDNYLGHLLWNSKHIVRSLNNILIDENRNISVSSNLSVFIAIQSTRIYFPVVELEMFCI